MQTHQCGVQITFLKRTLSGCANLRRLIVYSKKSLIVDFKILNTRLFGGRYQLSQSLFVTKYGYKTNDMEIAQFNKQYTFKTEILIKPQIHCSFNF